MKQDKNNPEANKPDNEGKKPEPPKNPVQVETNSWTDEVVNNDPAFDGAVLLSGYLGKSADEDSVVLYSDAGLNNKVTIKKSDIIHQKKEGGNHGRLESSLIWVKKDGEYSYKAGAEEAKAKFLEGDIYTDYLKTTHPGGPGGIPTTTAEIACPTVCQMPTYAPDCPHISLPGCVHTNPAVCKDEKAIITVPVICHRTYLPECWHTIFPPCQVHTVHQVFCPVGTLVCTIPVQSAACQQGGVANNAAEALIMQRPALLLLSAHGL